MDFCRFDTRLWSSPEFAEVLTSLDRYMLFYLFTNHHISLSGCCQTGVRTIAGETGLDQENIRRCLKHLHETGFIFYDTSTKEIFVKGWISCNWGGAPRRGAKICQAIQQIKNPSIQRASQAEYIEIKERRLSGADIQT